MTVYSSGVFRRKADAKVADAEVRLTANPGAFARPVLRLVVQSTKDAKGRAERSTMRCRP
jgi:hypothetical protein